MINGEIIRLETGKSGTFGVLKVDKMVYCVTLEPPDKENQQDVSSIPSGQYICEPVDSPKYGATFTVTGVANREHVLFHAGNVVSHTRGCILLAEHFGKLHGDRAVLNSGRTFENFLEYVGTEPFHLTIKEVY